jgi:hypothetical protein
VILILKQQQQQFTYPPPLIFNQTWRQSKNEAKEADVQAKKEANSASVAQKRKAEQENDPTLIKRSRSTSSAQKRKPKGKGWTAADAAAALAAAANTPRSSAVGAAWPANPDPVSLAKRYCEFPYFDDPVRGVSLLGGTPATTDVIIDDPGKGNMVASINQAFTTAPPGKSGNHFKYSRRQFQHESRQRKTKAKVAEFQERWDIKHNLNGVNGRTVDVEQFEAYLKARNQEFADTAVAYYDDDAARVAKWHAELNRRRALDNMCVALCKKLSSSQSYARRKEDRPIFVQGDWSRIGQAHLRGLPPVRSVGLTRVMATHFRLFLLDEYGSSSRHHKTFEPVTNVYTPKGRKLHSVLILPEKSYGHIQRDTLACLNQRAIYNHWVAIGKRHPGFVRL